MSNKTTNYAYDELGRLVGVTLANGAQAHYNYDAAGNRTTVLEIPALLSTFTPATVAALPKAQQGDFLQSPMAVLLSTGDIVSWGDNTNGNLANGVAAATNAPVQKVLFDPNTTLPPSTATIVDWAFTNANIYVVFSNGWVYSTGKNALGQLGHGDVVARTALKRIESFVTNGKSIIKVWASGASRLTDGGGCAYFQDSNFVMYGCGANAAGNLGNATTPISNVATPAVCTGVPSTPNHVTSVEIAAGRGGISTYMLCDDGTLKVAGCNDNGQLGVGSTANVTGSFVTATKTGAVNITNAISVSAAVGAANSNSGSALIVDATGAVWATGRNNFGQLGQGNTTDLTRFTQVSALSNIVEARFGGGYTTYGYALTNTGGFYTWGYNVQNNLFKNTVANVLTPTLVTALPAGVSKVFFPLGQEQTGNASQLIVLLANGKVIYAGGDAGQLPLASVINTGFYKYIATPRQILDGTETPVNILTHGTELLQRWFILTDKGNLYACGNNADSVCTGGISSDLKATSTEWFKIDFSNFSTIS